MLNARVLLEMRADGEVVPTGRGRKGVSTLWFIEKGNPRQVLEPNRNPCTLVVIIHEEAINQFLGMAFLEVCLVKGK
jgi:hypothetical protein